MRQILFYIFTFIYSSALIYLAITLPIGPNEAKLFYSDGGILYYLTHLSNGWFGNGLDFRFPFILFGLLNFSLFWIMTQFYFSQKKERYLSTTIFALLPGIITSALLVNIAVIVISLVLLFIIFYEKQLLLGEVIIMFLLLFIHDASVIFFVAVALFSILKKDRKLFYTSLFLIFLYFLYFYNLDIGGRPKGEFLQLFGLYMALFSPLVFIYFFYALYRIWLREKKDILWYISFTAFVLSILLSLRQQVDMTDFAPYVVVSVVLMVVLYYQTIQVRLPQFQIWYQRGFIILFGSLILSAMVIFFHKSFFYILDDKSKHFAYKFYEPYWQVLELKKVGQNCYTVKNQKVQFQLKYYGIEECIESHVPKIHR